MRWAKLSRRSVGSVVAILFIIAAILIAFVVINRFMGVQSKISEIQEEKVKLLKESLAISKSISSTWYYDEAGGYWVFTCEEWFTIKIYKRIATRITCLISAKKIVYGESVVVYGELKPAIEGKIRITFLSPKTVSYTHLTLPTN